MDGEAIACRLEGGVAWLDFARPRVLNAIDEDFCRRLAALFDEMESRSDVSVVVLSGGGARAFSAGADLTFMRALSGESLRRFIELTWKVFDRVARSHLVSIAAVHGYALGGGAELALACDVRIADETTKLGFPEMTLGSVPGSGAVQRLSPLVGRARAIELIVSGRHVDGREAETLGLVNKCVPSGQAALLAKEWSESFASRPSEALRFVKAALGTTAESSVAPVLHGLVSSVCQSAERYRGNTRSFTEKNHVMRGEIMTANFSGSKVVTAQDAVRLIKSGSTLVVGGAGGVQEPDALIKALVERFEASGEPNGLTEIHPIRTGEIEGRGTSRFGLPGLIRRMIGGSFWPVGVPELIRRINAEEIEAYNFSIGVIYGMLEATAANRPGVVTRVGLGTFQDPVHGGGSLNAISREKLVQTLQIEGESYLFYRAVPVDTCFVRATTADTDGNLSFEEEPAIIGPLLLAQAARANGGRVIAQVKRVVPAGSLAPHSVRVPGVMVDAVVVIPDQMQITHCVYDPTLVGAARLPLEDVPVRPMDAKKVVMRRAMLEARPGELLAIGFGIAGFLPAIAIEENVFDLVSFSIEHGVFGGINGYAAGGKTFPVAHNPVALVDAADQLRFFAGGGVDRAFLGVGEVDRAGNVNVSRFGERIPGAGGFVEMTQGIRNIVFCMLLEGRAERKVVPQVQDLTFNAAEAWRRGHSITYVSEKAVFRLGPDGLVLTEIAPGVDVRADILSTLGCEIQVADELSVMPEACFLDSPMGLRGRWLERTLSGPTEGNT